MNKIDNNKFKIITSESLQGKVNLLNKKIYDIDIDNKTSALLRLFCVLDCDL